MRISAGTKSKLTGLIGSLASTGLKLAAPATALALAFLLYIVLGPKLHMLSRMTAADRQYLHDSVTSAISLLRVASVVLVISLALRYLYEPLAGQVLSLVGAVLYFLSPTIFGFATNNAFSQIQTYQEIVAECMRLGFVALLPGGILVARDIYVRFITRVHTRAGELLLQGLKRRRVYEKCWDMPLCPDYIVQYCPAFIERKPCWRIKNGCLCESEGAFKAMAVKSTDDKFARHMVQGALADKRRAEVTSPAMKRMRCRKCVIYAEHQRQKYRIVSTLTFPAVGLFFWLFYNQLSALVYDVLEKTDRFMSFLAYNPGNEVSFASQGQILTTLALVCLGITVLSYALRGVEYLIFDLQV